MTCPYCQNDDPTLLKALSQDRKGNVVVGCEVCSKLFLLIKDGQVLKPTPTRV